MHGAFAIEIHLQLLERQQGSPSDKETCPSGKCGLLMSRRNAPSRSALRLGSTSACAWRAPANGRPPGTPGHNERMPNWPPAPHLRLPCLRHFYGTNRARLAIGERVVNKMRVVAAGGDADMRRACIRFCLPISSQALAVVPRWVAADLAAHRPLTIRGTAVLFPAHHASDDTAPPFHNHPALIAGSVPPYGRRSQGYKPAV